MVVVFWRPFVLISGVSKFTASAFFPGIAAPVAATPVPIRNCLLVMPINHPFFTVIVLAVLFEAHCACHIFRVPFLRSVATAALKQMVQYRIFVMTEWSLRFAWEMAQNLKSNPKFVRGLSVSPYMHRNRE
jgi:hypothetical protein